MFKHALLGFMSLLLVAGASAQKPKDDATHGGKVTVIVSHEVKDYAVWRKSFDSHGSVRTQFGFTTQGVYCDVKNPCKITVVGEFPNATAAEAFFASKDLHERMANSGVLGKPDVKVLTVGAK